MSYYEKLLQKINIELFFFHSQLSTIESEAYTSSMAVFVYFCEFSN